MSMKKSSKKLLVTYKNVKSIKKVLQELKAVRKSPPSEKPKHAEINQSTRNASKLSGCNKTQTQNQRRRQSIPEYHNTTYFLT